MVLMFEKVMRMIFAYYPQSKRSKVEKQKFFDEMAYV